MNQEEFIQQINTKQEAAFNDLFEVFYRYLVLYAMRHVQQQEVAEDIVQEVFVAIWESDKEYNTFHGFRSFLYDSVKNSCLNYLKHKAVEKRYEAYVQKEQEEDEDFRLMREEMYREVYRVVNELPDRCREVFGCHLQGKKNEEIAQLLSLSIETVKTQKRKAMRVLREELGKTFYLYLVSSGI